MKSGTSSLVALRLHMIAAENEDICDIREHLIQLLRGDPVSGIVAVVVVAVHRSIIRNDEGVLAAVSVLILRAHMVAVLRLCHIRI